MKADSLKKCVGFVVAVLSLSACNDAIEVDKAGNQNTSASQVVPLKSIEDRVANTRKAKQAAVEVDVTKNKVDEAGAYDQSSMQEKQVLEEEPVVLDFSLNFEQLEFIDKANSPAENRQKLLNGIFEPDDVSSNFAIEAHFAEPYNENKEMETTPDGAGVKFNLGF